MNYAIIAAGEGSRLAQEGMTIPKPLVPLNGTPMIKRLIDIFIKCNAESISVIVNEEMTEVREFLRTMTLDIPFNIVVKSTPSSMHSFFELCKVMQPGKFCLTTVDTIFKEKDFAGYISQFEKETRCDGMMAVTPYIEDEKPLYIETDKDLIIKSFRDEKFNGVKYISGGVYALNDKAVEVLRLCMEQGVSRMRNYQRALIDAGLKLKAYPIEKIIDVDHITDIPVAESFIKD